MNGIQVEDHPRAYIVKQKDKKGKRKRKERV